MANFMMAQSHLPKASDLWYQKVRAEFRSLDVDKNGFLSLRDKERMTNRFIEKNHRVQHSNAEKRFRQAMEDLWKMVEVKPKVTYEDYLVERLELLDVHLKDVKKCRLQRTGFYDMFFDFIDLNRDKKWDLDEASMYFNMMVGGDRELEERQHLFDTMDKDRDGLINFDEFACALYSFEFDQEPGEFDLMFGPLPSVEEAKPKNPMFK